MVPNNTGDSPAPVVSIITPAYNAARYIEHTLESAAMQTFAGFGLFIADDGGACSPEKSVSLDPRRMDCRRPDAKQPPA